MVTYAQLEDEQWWGREITTSPMTGLGLQLRAAYGTGTDSWGTKGNNRHLSGGHRSQEWIKNSQYCENHSYTVESGLTVTEARYIAAFDFTPSVWGTPDNRAKMIVLTGRLITAMKAGQLDELVEVFGTLDGRTVTGWNNDANREVTADDTHLDHVHGRVRRKFANSNDVMARIADVMLGEGDDMTPAQGYNQFFDHNMLAGLVAMNDLIKIPAYSDTGQNWSATTRPNILGQAIKTLQATVDRIEAKVDALSTIGGGNCDLTEVRADIAKVKADTDALISGVKANAAALVITEA
jgi:hypothetical protein